MKYPWPMTVVVDIRTEFLAEFTEMIQKDVSATKKVITTKTQQANPIIE